MLLIHLRFPHLTKPYLSAFLNINTAAPHVAGLAAHLLQKDSTLMASEVLGQISHADNVSVMDIDCRSPAAGIATVGDLNCQDANTAACLPEDWGMSSGSDSGLGLPTGQVKTYMFTTASQAAVSCTTSGNNGDADLYVKFNSMPQTSTSGSNECYGYSSNSNEACTTPTAPAGTTVFASVHAWSAFSNLAVACAEDGGGGGGGGDGDNCAAVGASCTSDSACCGNKCRGGPGRKTCK